MTRVSSSFKVAVSWLLRPAVDPLTRGGAVALAGLRILVGALWLFNVVWKRPPDFGKAADRGLYRFTKDAVDHPVFPPYSWLVEHLVLPHFTPFGYGVLAAETALAVLLLTGTLVRLAALLGVAQSLAIGLSVARTPGEWPWSYWMLIGIHVVLLLTAAGSVAAVDAVRGASIAGRGADTARRLVGGWGAVLALTALWAVTRSAGEDFLASRGTTLEGTGLSVSLGSYNLLGALVLGAVAVLMLLAAALRRREFAWGAAVVAALAAVTLYAQLSRTDVWLGGSNTSAALFLCAAVVSSVTAGRLGSSRHQPSTRETLHA